MSFCPLGLYLRAVQSVRSAGTGEYVSTFTLVLLVFTNIAYDVRNKILEGSAVIENNQ